MLESYVKHPPLLIVLQGLEEQAYDPNMMISYRKTYIYHDTSIISTIEMLKCSLQMPHMLIWHTTKDNNKKRNKNVDPFLKVSVNKMPI